MPPTLPLTIAWLILASKSNDWAASSAYTRTAGGAVRVGGWGGSGSAVARMSACACEGGLGMRARAGRDVADSACLLLGPVGQPPGATTQPALKNRLAAGGC
jgi:hypothetical protein